MPDAVLLTQETYDRIMSVIQSIEKGDFIRVGSASPIRILEVGANGEVTLDLNTDVCPAA